MGNSRKKCNASGAKDAKGTQGGENRFTKRRGDIEESGDGINPVGTVLNAGKRSLEKSIYGTDIFLLCRNGVCLISRRSSVGCFNDGEAAGI